MAHASSAHPSDRAHSPTDPTLPHRDRARRGGESPLRPRGGGTPRSHGIRGDARRGRIRRGCTQKRPDPDDRDEGGRIMTPDIDPVINMTVFAAFVAVTLFVVVTVSRRNRTATDFSAGGRSFSGAQNGVALSGDYLSAASFLGICGAIAVAGSDGFFYSIGFLVAELLRNTGKFTMAHVLSFRLKQRPVRLVAALATLAVCFFYLIAQMAGAGNLVSLLMGSPSRSRRTSRSSPSACSRSSGELRRRTRTSRSSSHSPSRSPRARISRPSSIRCSGGGSTPGARCGRCTGARELHPAHRVLARSLGRSDLDVPRRGFLVVPALESRHRLDPARVRARRRWHALDEALPRSRCKAGRDGGACVHGCRRRARGRALVRGTRARWSGPCR